MEYSGKKRRQAKQPECGEDVLVNLHRYPLVVWNVPEPSQDSADSLLQFGTMTPLSSFLASTCESGEDIEWQNLMEWFVCAAIGLESTSLWCNDSFWLDWDDVVVDSFGISRINMFHSPACLSPPRITSSRLSLHCLVSRSDSMTPVHDWDAALGSFREGKRRGSDKRS
ncbi:hypothetical protein BLNAU_25061 [Blattamonas nauphoetae]|uniref:Uncharacterized protein n=1 Tax=Blattamonas nauphoetae TaxID=2049346 RepID=A0ABQ9WLG8_9EUKA|nr:hypothetical protein BLNAU_25061 [Blattamonas nauphoetae]